MKKIKIKILFITMLLFSSVALLSSCGPVDIGIEIGNTTNAYREATDYLCSRVWIDEWVDNYGDRHRQELRFDHSGVGQDYVMIMDRRGNVQENTYRFVWDWYSANYTSLKLNYGGGDYSYIDNMRMGNNMIECLLDGTPVRFYGR